MPAIPKDQAAHELAAIVETSKPSALAEISAELFPEKSALVPLSAVQLAQYIRSGLEAEEIVDLWNVVFPEDKNVWYDEEAGKIYYNEEAVGFAEAD